MDISVIICAHNPRSEYLARVLDALKAQKLAKDRWEILIVDNASVPAIDPLHLSPNIHARCIREQKLGLSFARIRGMTEALGNLLVFVDDDNILDQNYLTEALRIKSSYEHLGVWGGSIVPEFEVPPPDHIKSYLHYLAIRYIDRPRWSNVLTCIEAEPCGAGLCIRAEVATEYVSRCLVDTAALSDRVGESLTSGGDTEIAYTACSLGYGMGLFPSLVVTHLIPKERLQEKYLLRLAEGIETSVHLVRYKWQGVIPDAVTSAVGLLRMLKLVLSKRGFHRRMYLTAIKARSRARKIIDGRMRLEQKMMVAKN